MFTSPVTAGAVERRISRLLQPAVRVALVAGPFAFGLLLAVLAFELWIQRTPTLEPRHRAEALCFALAQSPRFAPPMGVEPSAAMVRGRFPLGTPPTLALRMAMRFDDPQVARESVRRVGDFDVAVVWLRVPESNRTGPCLVVGWMEGGDLAVCSFRFAGGDSEVNDEQKLWGERLLGRILQPDYFVLGSLPSVRLRAEKGETLPNFGPRTQG
ncbi:MAG: hypothetical protein ABIS67_14745 [Candidatus Eisenbacteria bacterium]